MNLIVEIQNPKEKELNEKDVKVSRNAFELIKILYDLSGKIVEFQPRLQRHFSQLSSFSQACML